MAQHFGGAIIRTGGGGLSHPKYGHVRAFSIYYLVNDIKYGSQFTVVITNKQWST